MLELLKQAGKLALPTSKMDNRCFWLAAIGIRRDQTRVSSINGSIQKCFSVSLNPKGFERDSSFHAEGRVLRKMGRGGVIYVSRISRKTGELAMARPCSRCQAKIRSQNIEKVYYTINNTQYGLWIPSLDTDRVF